MKFTVDTLLRDFVNSLTDQTSAVIPALTLGDKSPVAFEFAKDGAIDESIGALDTVEVALSSCVTPDRGTFTLSAPGGPITGDPITLPATTSWKALASAIAASWDGVSLSDLCVTGGNGFFRVEFQGNLADTEIDPMTGDGTKLSPRSVVSVNQKAAGGGGQNAVQIISLDSVPLAYADDLTFDDGVFSGILNVDTVAANEAMREAKNGRVSRLLSVRVTDDEGNRTTYAKRPTIVDCTGIPMGPFGNNTLTRYLTMQQGDKRYDRLFIDITRFGAAGDGDNDDSTILQDAINLASAVGGGLVFLPGSNDFYRMTRTIRLRSNVALCGSGIDRSRLIWDENSEFDVQTLKPHHGVHAVQWGGNGTTEGCQSGITTAREDGEGTVSNVSVRDLTIDLNQFELPDLPQSQTGGLHVYNAEDVTIERVKVRNVVFPAMTLPHWGDGFMIAHCNRVSLNDCDAELCGKSGLALRNGAKGIQVKGFRGSVCNDRIIHLGPECENVILDDIMLDISSTDMSPGSQGINVQGGAHTQISNVVVDLGGVTSIRDALVIRGIGAFGDSVPRTVQVSNFKSLSSDRRGRIRLMGFGDTVELTNVSIEGRLVSDLMSGQSFGRLLGSNVTVVASSSSDAVLFTDGIRASIANLVAKNEGSGFSVGFSGASRVQLYGGSATSSDASAYRARNASKVSIHNAIGDSGNQASAAFFAQDSGTVLQNIGCESVSPVHDFSITGGIVESINVFPPS